MKIYQRIFFDTERYDFEVFTAKTKLEADLKAWEWLVNDIEQGKNVFNLKEAYNNGTFEDFCEDERPYYYYRDGGTLECELVVTEI